MSINEAMQRDEGAVHFERDGTMAILTLARPQALNALTWAMYEQIEGYLDSLFADETLRVLVLQGEGKAFAAGTDIAQFRGFTGEDGKLYEQKMERIIYKLESFPRPVIAAIHGYAVGAGIVLSSVCDLRYATPSSRFGAPIARTLGNALSLKNYQRLINGFGAMRAREMLFTAHLLSAEEALQSGFLTAIVEEGQLFTHVREVARQISALAPLTIWATKEAQRRMSAATQEIAFDDVMERIYASRDFAEGVQAYLEKRKPDWQGR